MNGEALWTNERAAVRMQQWSRKKHPIVPGTFVEVWPPSCRLCRCIERLTEGPHWQVGHHVREQIWNRTSNEKQILLSKCYFLLLLNFLVRKYLFWIPYCKCDCFCTTACHCFTVRWWMRAFVAVFLAVVIRKVIRFIYRSLFRLGETGSL